MCQKSDQDPVIRGWKFKLLLKFVKTSIESRQLSDIVQVAFPAESSRLSRSQSDSDPICIFVMVKNDRICPDTDQTTQDIVTILIRYSRIGHDIVTIVIRLDKIGWVRSDNDRTFQIIEDSNPTFSLYVS